MSSLLEEYNEIYEVLERFRSDIDGYKKEIASIAKRRDDEIPKRIENLKNQLKKIDDYQMKITGFIQLAEKHMRSKNLPTIEAPAGYRVNLSRLRNLAMMIDPLSEDDNYAQRVYLIANCDLKFLEQKKSEFQSKIIELDKDYSVGAPDEIKRLNGEIDKVKHNRREFLESDTFTGFAERVVSENQSYMYLNAPESFDNKVGAPFCQAPGAYGTVLSADPDDRKYIKSLLGKFYDEDTEKVYIPITSISSEEEMAMAVKCIPARKRMAEMDSGLRKLLFDQLNKNIAGTKKVYVYDAIRYNNSVLGSLKDLEESGYVAPVPKNPEQLEDSLRELISTFDDMDDVLENHDSVIEYNKTVPEDKKLVRSVVVFIGWPNAFSGESVKLVQRIITNYERYGISFIAVKVSSDNKDNNETVNDFGLSDYVGENVVNIIMRSSDITYKKGKGSEHSFLWYGFGYKLNEKYVQEFNSHKKDDSTVGNIFPQRHPMNVMPEYSKSYKPVVLPFGIDGKDQECFVSFEHENFAAYLVGASRSGKSTLLHTLIAGLIMNYHPDNLELWLADFKQLEFKKYIKNMPPHVKYILLDESPELVYDLIDKLTEKMMERQRLFAILGVEKIDQVDLTKLQNPLPVIFVILDEFSIMSQSISQNETYKIRLQNLLAKGAALGIKFIFSSQTFTNGVGGLTQTARAQIQQRIAMKGTLDEITETLELTSNIKTEKVVHWMESLPPHYALIKHRISADTLPEVNRVHVSYIPDYSVRDDMIKMINNNMHVADHFDLLDMSAYVEKSPVCLDGNSYESFESRSGAFLDHINSLKKSVEYSGDEMFLNLGTPRRMESLSPIVISPETGENILFISNSSEMISGCAVINSSIKSYSLQNGKIQIWAYERNRLYRIHKDIWKENDLLTNVDDVADRIHQIKTAIENREDSNELIILFGLDRFITEFELSDAPEGNKGKKKTGSSMDKIMKTGGVVEVDDNEPSLFEMLNSFDDETSENDENAETSEEEAIHAPEDNTNTDTSSEDIETTDEDESEEQFNTIEELQYILKQGSRQGYHFMVVLNSLNDMKACGIKFDQFRHRLSFATNRDDSWSLFGNNSAVGMPEHICRYSDTQNTYSFRPYLHKEFCWDGWIVNDSGIAETVSDL